MTDTKEKLSEAKYFFEEMIKNKKKPDFFRYSLSAFVSAFRSVTSFMQKEFHGIDGFADWYTTQQKTMRADKNMCLLNKKRVMTIHTEPIRSHACVKFSISVPVISRIRFADGTVVGPSGPMPKHSKREKWRWFFDELPDDNLLNICQGCMIKLESIVSECEQKFDKNRKTP